MILGQVLHVPILCDTKKGEMYLDKKNPIAEQSKKWLIEALLVLMKEKPYKDITIKEITEKALLSRRTFYRNFSAKEDLLSQYAWKLCNEYISCLRNETNLSLPNIACVYFKFWQEHLSFLEILQKNNLFYLLPDKYNEYLPEIYNIFKGNRHEYDSPENLTYVLAFSAGGFWNMLSRWILDGALKSPEEMSNIVQQAICHF